MRTIKELLQLILEHQGYFETCLCKWIEELYIENIIEFEEWNSLNKYIMKQRPITKPVWDVWWPKRELQPRINWINQQLEIL
jgi:hypothetical protein